MMKIKPRMMLAAMMLAGGAVSACGMPADEHSNDDVAAIPVQRSGLKIAQAHCAACHSIGRKGESPHSEALEFRRFSEFYPVQELEEALAEGIYVGHPDMPVFRFEPDEVEALIDYIQSIQDPLET